MGWFLNTRDIHPGSSAVLNDDYTLFYFIHLFGTFLIVIGMVLCALVVVSIHYRLQKERWDFSDRFPFYLAVTDFLWGASHITDHFLLLITQTYPSKSLGIVLSIIGYTFFGYQQMMHTGLAAYIYLKVVKRKNVDLGRGEWKLHFFSIALPILNVLLFAFFDAFGPSGYWFLLNPNSLSGKILGFFLVIFASVHAIGVHLAYQKIQSAINVQHETMTVYECKAQFLKLPSPPHQTPKRHNRRHSVATQCLTSFIRVYIFLFYPLAVIMGAIAMQYSFEVIEPISTVLLVIVGNSCGSANAISYFYNERIKKKALVNRSDAPTPSTLSANSKFTPVD